MRAAQQRQNWPRLRLANAPESGVVRLWYRTFVRDITDFRECGRLIGDTRCHRRWTVVDCVVFDGVFLHSFHRFRDIIQSVLSTIDVVCDGFDVTCDAFQCVVHITDGQVLNAVVSIEYDAIDFGYQLIDAIETVAHVIVVMINLTRIITTRQTIALVTGFARALVNARTGLLTDGILRTRERFGFAVIDLIAFVAITEVTFLANAGGASRTGFGAVGVSIARVFGGAEIDLFAFTFRAIADVTRQTRAFERTRTRRFARRFHVARTRQTRIDRCACDAISAIA